MRDIAIDWLAEHLEFTRETDEFIEFAELAFEWFESKGVSVKEGDQLCFVIKDQTIEKT